MCSNTELRRREYDGAGTHVVEQCMRCGEQKGSSIAHDDIDKDPSALPEFDDGLRDRWQERKQDAQNRRKAEIEDWKARRDQAWRRKYNRYIKRSDRWQKKREAVLERDSYTCQACLHRKATEVHHLTYENIGDEPLFDLVAICGPCHQKLHNRRRRRENSGYWPWKQEG